MHLPAFDRAALIVRRRYAWLWPVSLALALGCLGTSITGCADSDPARAHTSALPPLQEVDPVAAVRLSPLYRQAQQDCRAKQYDQAAGLLERLAASPDLTADQAAFCREQRAICLRDAGGQARLSSFSRPLLASLPTSPTMPSTVPWSTAPLTPDQADCGPRALSLVCAHLHRSCSLADLRRTAGTTAKGTTLAGLAAAAGSVGLKARGVQVDLPALERLSGPAIAWVSGNHYVAVLSVNGDTCTVHDPNQPREEDIPTHDLLARSGGMLLILSR